MDIQSETIKELTEAGLGVVGSDGVDAFIDWMCETEGMNEEELRKDTERLAKFINDYWDDFVEGCATMGEVRVEQFLIEA